MSRLASLSTPLRSRSSLSPSPGPQAGSQSPVQTTSETTHHRMLRLVLEEIKTLHRTWDDVVAIDGFKAAKGIIDESTNLDNLLQTKDEERPSLVEHYRNLQSHRIGLDTSLNKLNKLLSKLSVLIDQAEKIYFEAYRIQGSEWVKEEPLWLSWTLEHFINSLPPLSSLHVAHLSNLTDLSKTILNPQTSFDTAKSTLERWRDISMGGQRYDSVKEWEELIDLEMSMGGEISEEEDKVVVVGSAKKKRGKK